MRAFTLIEVLIYIGLFALLLTGTLAGLLNISESSRRESARGLLETEGDFLIGKIGWYVEQSGTAPILGGGGTSLTLSSTDGEPVVVFLDKAAVMVRQGDTDALSLSSGDITVEHLIFSQSADGPAYIRMQLTLSGHDGNGRAFSDTFARTQYLPPYP